MLLDATSSLDFREREDICAHIDGSWLPVMPVGPEDESRLGYTLF